MKIRSVIRTIKEKILLKLKNMEKSNDLINTIEFIQGRKFNGKTIKQLIFHLI